jgi:hypothetical protein
MFKLNTSLINRLHKFLKNIFTDTINDFNVFSQVLVFIYLLRNINSTTYNYLNNRFIYFIKFFKFVIIASLCINELIS